MAARPYFRIEMLPARHGDALFVEYGKPGGPTRRLMIDGGPLPAFPDVVARLDRLPEGDRRVELLVVTHVDTDHVEGVVRLLAPPASRWPIDPREIWFNGWRHLVEADTLGGREGEFMSALIEARAGEIWNREFDGHAVCAGGARDRVIELADGMRLTLLSPDADALVALRDDWREAAESWDLGPGDLDSAWEQLAETDKFHPGEALTLGPDDLTTQLLRVLRGRDGSAANGSSIAFVAEFEGKSCAFLGDAHADVVCRSLERLGYSADAPLEVDALKLAHHGSKNNITRRLLELIDARHFLVSSNGDRFSHPDAPAIEAVVRGARRKPTLWFNYRSAFNQGWEAKSAEPGARFRTRYPAEGKRGIRVTL